MKTEWKISASEVTGTSHVSKNLPCQDKTYWYKNNGVTCISLADGAGSAKYSHYGAEFLTNNLSKYLVDHFYEFIQFDDDDIIDKLSIEIKALLSKLVEKYKKPEYEFSSTFLSVVFSKNSFISIHIGDGAIGYLRKDKVEVLSAPENGEHSNETWFTTAKCLKEKIRISRGSTFEVSGFILFSDGVETFMYDPENNSITDAAINILYQNLKIDSKSMNKLLFKNLSDIAKLRTKDDCSIIVCSRSRFKNLNEYKKYRKKVAKRK